MTAAMIDIVGKRVTIIDRDDQGIVGHGIISSFSTVKRRGEQEAFPIQAEVEFSLAVEMTDRQLIKLLWTLLTQQQLRLQADRSDG